MTTMLVDVIDLAPNEFFPFVPPFENGERMGQEEFHELYETTPKGFRAELINGIVHMPSPVRMRHGGPQWLLAAWLVNYCAATEGLESYSDITSILSEKNEPQPDVALIVYPEIGGQTKPNAKGYLTGAPEFAIEIAHSSYGIDMNEKKTEYEKFGVLEYMVVAIRSRTVHFFHRRAGRFVSLKEDSDGILKSRVFPGLWLDPAAVFCRTPNRLFEVLQRGLATPEHAKFAAKMKAKLAKIQKESE
jgi:Uma2 family endonuclease